MGAAGTLVIIALPGRPKRAVADLKTLKQILLQFIKPSAPLILTVDNDGRLLEVFWEGDVTSEPLNIYYPPFRLVQQGPVSNTGEGTVEVTFFGLEPQVTNSKLEVGCGFQILQFGNLLQNDVVIDRSFGAQGPLKVEISTNSNIWVGTVEQIE
jgi:hypothetical protein